MIYEVGNKVRYSDDISVGEIKEVRDDNVSTGPKYLVAWGRHTDWADHDDIVLVDEERDKQIAAEVQAKFDEATSALEKAWEAFSAGKEIAKSSIWFLREQKLIDLDPLVKIAENFGWSSSSFYCSLGE